MTGQQGARQALRRVRLLGSTWAPPAALAVDSASGEHGQAEGQPEVGEQPARVDAADAALAGSPPP